RLDVRREAGLVAAELDEQGGRADIRGAAQEVGVAGQSRPGRQPGVGCRKSAEADYAVVGEVWAPAEQGAVGPVVRIKPQVDAAQVRVRPVDGEDAGGQRPAAVGR